MVWRKSRTRRKFFEEYAKEHSFDPNDPSSWYLQPSARIMAVKVGGRREGEEGGREGKEREREGSINELSKGARQVIAYHNNSIKQALLDLFPNIGLERAMFPKKGLLSSLSFFFYLPFLLFIAIFSF